MTKFSRVLSVVSVTAVLTACQSVCPASPAVAPKAQVNTIAQSSIFNPFDNFETSFSLYPSIPYVRSVSGDVVSFSLNGGLVASANRLANQLSFTKEHVADLGGYAINDRSGLPRSLQYNGNMITVQFYPGVLLNESSALNYDIFTGPNGIGIYPGDIRNLRGSIDVKSSGEGYPPSAQLVDAPAGSGDYRSLLVKYEGGVFNGVQEVNLYFGQVKKEFLLSAIRQASVALGNYNRGDKKVSVVADLDDDQLKILEGDTVFTANHFPVGVSEGREIKAYDSVTSSRSIGVIVLRNTFWTKPDRINLQPGQNAGNDNILALKDQIRSKYGMPYTLK